MKKLAFFLVFAVIIGAFGVYAQTKDEDIHRLLMLSGVDKLADQLMDAMIPQYQQMLPDVPNIFWVRLRERVNMEGLIYACVPVYAKYYTHDEIRQLIAFYESPLGRRMIEVTPALSQETMVIGQQWGQKLGQDIVNELIKEGYVSN